MSAAQDIQALRTRAGGLLVRQDTVRRGGAVDAGGDLVVVDLLISERAIAYLPSGADRVHAQRISRIRADGDEWVIETDSPSVRLVVGPLWLDEQRREAARLARVRPEPEALAELQRMFDSLAS